MVVAMVGAILSALQFAVFMFWEVLWPLALGFLLSGIIQAL
ncbi:MAG: permease, partial [Chloroflexi bacterium]